MGTAVVFGMTIATPDRHLPYPGLLRLSPEPRGDAEKADASYPCARTRDSRTLMSFGR